MGHTGGRLGRAVVLLVAALPLLRGTVQGQTTGSIEGRVADAAGDPLPGVTVEAASPSLQGQRVAVTDRRGTYHFPATPPGDYRVRAVLPGFRSDEKTLTVALDATATADFVLQPAAQEQVVVSGEAPLIDRTATTSGTNYTSDVISHLPVARNYADIVRANPGVSTDRGETQGRSLSLTVYGATSAENQWIIDGVNTTNGIKGSRARPSTTSSCRRSRSRRAATRPSTAAPSAASSTSSRSPEAINSTEAPFFTTTPRPEAAQDVGPQDSLIGEMRVADYERTDFGADLGAFSSRTASGSSPRTTA